MSEQEVICLGWYGGETGLFAAAEDSRLILWEERLF